MKLPNAEQARVDREKLLDYLLNPVHPDNGGKASFFLSHGFGADNWLALAAAFRELAMRSQVVRVVDSPHGRKYVLDGRMTSPAGRTLAVRTVWIVDTGRDEPRLVTAYPEAE